MNKTNLIKHLLILLFVISIFSVESCKNGENTDETNKKENEITEEDNNKKTEKEEINWDGNWSYFWNGGRDEISGATVFISYDITISGEECKHDANGYQTYLEFKCRGEVKGDKYIVYFVEDLGDSWTELKKGDVLFTLKKDGDKLIAIDDDRMEGEDSEKIFEKIEEEETVVKNNVIDYTKFEHYATILTKEDLTMKFGESDLIDGEVTFAEGTVTYETTTLKNATTGHTITFLWEDDGNTTASIQADHNLYDKNNNIIGTQMVITESELFTGMSLSGLRKWNGADFKFSGFGWDYGGSINQSEKSRITKSPIGISLSLRSEDDFDFAYGDVELSADDERLKYASIVVSQIKMYIK